MSSMNVLIWLKTVQETERKSKEQKWGRSLLVAVNRDAEITTQLRIFHATWKSNTPIPLVRFPSRSLQKDR